MSPAERWTRSGERQGRGLRLRLRSRSSRDQPVLRTHRRGDGGLLPERSAPASRLLPARGPAAPVVLTRRACPIRAPRLRRNGSKWESSAPLMSNPGGGLRVRRRGSAPARQRPASRAPAAAGADSAAGLMAGDQNDAERPSSHAANKARTGSTPPRRWSRVAPAGEPAGACET